MKRIVIVSLCILISFSLAAAQSGRRKTAPAPTPSVSVTDTVTSNSTTDEVGYSESATNQPRSIYVSPEARNNARRQKEKADAKKTPKAAPTAPQPTLPATGEEDDEIVKVETNLITIPVSVYDRNGIYIPNLRQPDFKIFENGKEQEIAYFGTSDKPFTVILLIDVSPSTAFKIEQIQDAAIAFVDQLKPQDSVMVVEFDASVHLLTEATNDRQKIYKGIRKADFGDGTSLYDAVHYSLERQLSKVEGRKAIVLFTDGVDTTSYKAQFETTIAEAEESESLIFPIYYNTFLDSRGIGTGGVMSTPPTLGMPPSILGGGMSGQSTSEDYARGRAYLEQLAGATGGRVFRPESTPGGLTTAFEGIAEELRRQYNIGYYPIEGGKPGERKQIKVRVDRPRLVVRARDSYIVGAK
jgi:Ca-activated chloride channel family protein